MNVQTFKTVYKSIFDAMDKADRRIGYVDHGMSPNADASTTLVVSVAAGEYVKNSETSLTSYAGGTVTITAGNVSHARVDAVYMSSLGVLTQASGTPASLNPVAASWPAGATPLAICYVPAGATAFTGNAYVGDVAQYKRFLEPGTPSVAWASVASPGTAQRFVRVDDQIQLFDNNDPASVRLGGASNPGTTSFAARSNHGHEQKFIGTRVFNTTPETVPSTGQLVVSFDAERFDTDPASMHSSAASTSKLKFRTAGKYAVGFGCELGALTTGAFSAQLRLNGTSFIAQQTVVPAGATARLNVGTLYDFISTDYVEAVVSNTGASAVAIASTGNYTPEFWAYKVG